MKDCLELPNIGDDLPYIGWKKGAWEIIQGIDKLLLHVSTKHGCKRYLFHDTNKKKEAKNYSTYRGTKDD